MTELNTQPIVTEIVKILGTPYIVINKTTVARVLKPTTMGRKEYYAVRFGKKTKRKTIDNILEAMKE